MLKIIILVLFLITVTRSGYFDNTKELWGHTLVTFSKANILLLTPSPITQKKAKHEVDPNLEELYLLDDSDLELEKRDPMPRETQTSKFLIQYMGESLKVFIHKEPVNGLTYLHPMSIYIVAPVNTSGSSVITIPEIRNVLQNKLTALLIKQNIPQKDHAIWVKTKSNYVKIVFDLSLAKKMLSPDDNIFSNIFKQLLNDLETDLQNYALPKPGFEKIVSDIQDIVDNPEEFSKLIQKTQMVLDPQNGSLDLYRRVNISQANTKQPQKAYILGDTHTNFQNILSVLYDRDSSGEIRIEEIKKGKAHFIILGDIIDPEWKTPYEYYINEISWRQNRSNNDYNNQLCAIAYIFSLICKYPDRIHYVTGNHEYCFSKSYRTMKNLGQIVIEYDLAKLLDEKYLYMSGEIDVALKCTFLSLPVIVEITTRNSSIIATHSGAQEDDIFSTLERWRKYGIVSPLYSTDSNIDQVFLSFLTGRNYKGSNIRGTLGKFGADILVAGHTKTMDSVSLPEKLVQEADSSYAIGEQFIILDSTGETYSMFEIIQTEEEKLRIITTGPDVQQGDISFKTPGEKTTQKLDITRCQKNIVVERQV